jgi:hypothetical protein
MNMAKLIVHGDDLTLASIIEVLPSDPERQWRKGEAKSVGRVYLDSGFEVLVAQASQSQVLPSRLRSYLAECSSRGVSFDMPRIVAELQLELHADAGQEPLDFSLADLQVLTEMGISLSIVTRPA